ncbi:MAG: 16S rRNA (uracil(1498)-N(3))-methyltransferase [Tahibacter sp.]
MRIPRIYVQDALHSGMTITLPEQAGEHVVRVLRLEPGFSILLFNGDGFDYAAELVSVARRAVSARVGVRHAMAHESPLRVTLVQGIARGDKMDWILQKSTELGVEQVIPVFTDRTEVKLDEERAERRTAHWQQVVIAACEQCGRSRVPRVSAPLRLSAWASALGESPGQRLALMPEGALRARDIEWHSESAWLVVGPEGGLSDKDVAILTQAGFRGLGLGPRILRTETAGIAALTVLQTLRGDLA